MTTANTPSPLHSRLIILGSGPAGYTAAIYAARAMLSPMLIAGMQQGGQLTITTDVENYPGFADPIQGPWLMEQMQAQAVHMGTQLVSDHILAADLSKRPFTLTGDSGQIYTCDSLIIATGARALMLNVPGEDRLLGHGVSTCATCDGFFFRDHEIVVVGGGDSALEEAMFLTRFAKKVTLIHRRDSLRASKIMQERALANEKIEFLWNTQVTEVIGDTKVEKILVRNTVTGENSEMAATGVFVAIGHQPATDLFADQLELHDNGYLKVHDGSLTSIEGVFACGDVQDHHYRQAITAAGSGCMAAIDAERWLESQGA